MTSLAFGEAPETDDVRAADRRIVEATLPHLPPVVADMVRLQMLTGMRSAELCAMRMADLERRKRAPWIYRPASHKTQRTHRIKEIVLVPEAQAIVKRYLKLDRNAHLFSPRESERARNRARGEARKTPRWASHMDRNARKRKSLDKRSNAPGGSYSTASYRRAITRACAKAKVPAWTPHRIRHLVASIGVEQAGEEATRRLLGHASSEVTARYARDADRKLQERAAEAVARELA